MQGYEYYYVCEVESGRPLHVYATLPMHGSTLFVDWRVASVVVCQDYCTARVC